tara:strand:- start:1301 stop:1609 length:309 start_codon:yes stop_codon:yes gene_type:complete
MKYDIDAVRCYQSVMFEKRQDTFFATRQINERIPLKLELIEGINVISIKSERDHILIPLTNVSAIYLKSPLKVEQEEKNNVERAKMNSPQRVDKPSKARNRK